ncbi:MAG: hypothetical protein WBV39_11140 [Rudaea sp.]
MRSHTGISVVFGTVLAFAATLGVAQPVKWGTVANNGEIAPGGDPTQTFRSYNQPAINDAQLVVFRARSRPSAGGAQIDGVYSMDFATPGSIAKLLARDDAVPEPNNTDYQGLPSAFTEFPSIPRIDATSSLMATRGAHQPVWTYLLDATETRVGTAGIYAFASPSATAVTGASLLGSSVEPDQVTLSFPQYSVPGTILGTRFDQFPGSPALFNDRYIAFKGNYTDLVDGLGRTGVYYRDVLSDNPARYTGLIANSDMLIPNQPVGGTVRFDSTAPPSAANGYVYFTGLDNEDAPTLGGIYRARIPTGTEQPQLATPPLEVMAGIGDQVPGEAPGVYFSAFGEGLSVSSDGSEVAFWASWGTDTFPKTLFCPTDGNADVIAYCNQQYPNGYSVNIPVNQGIFVHDAISAQTIRIARTGHDGLEDFLFWVFSGAPPGTGGADEDREPARWRSSAFAALSAPAGRVLQVAFKAQRNGVDGIYAREAYQPALVTIAEVGNTPGTALDPLAPAGSTVSSVGIEREGFRNGNLVLTASMLYVDPLNPDVTVSWGGIYAGPVDLDKIFDDGFEE